MADRMAMLEKLGNAFAEEQAEVLSEVIFNAYNELVRRADFNELKDVVRDWPRLKAARRSVSGRWPRLRAARRSVSRNWPRLRAARRSVSRNWPRLNNEQNTRSSNLHSKWAD